MICHVAAVCAPIIADGFFVNASTVILTSMSRALSVKKQTLFFFRLELRWFLR